MAKVRTGKSAPKSAPEPSRASFVPGSWPISTRAPTPPRIKPDKASRRDYGKAEAPTPFGNTSLTSRS